MSFQFSIPALTMHRTSLGCLKNSWRFKTM